MSYCYHCGDPSSKCVVHGPSVKINRLKMKIAELEEDAKFWKASHDETAKHFKEAEQTIERLRDKIFSLDCQTIVCEGGCQICSLQAALEGEKDG